MVLVLQQGRRHAISFRRAPLESPPEFQYQQVLKFQPIFVAVHLIDRSIGQSMDGTRTRSRLRCMYFDRFQRHRAFNSTPFLYSFLSKRQACGPLALRLRWYRVQSLRIVCRPPALTRLIVRLDTYIRFIVTNRIPIRHPHYSDGPASTFAPIFAILDPQCRAASYAACGAAALRPPIPPGWQSPHPAATRSPSVTAVVIAPLAASTIPIISR